MKLAPWYAVALLPFAAVVFGGALLAHAALVAVTVAIFRGTLALRTEAS